MALTYVKNVVVDRIARVERPEKVELCVRLVLESESDVVVLRRIQLRSRAWRIVDVIVLQLRIRNLQRKLNIQPRKDSGCKSVKERLRGNKFVRPKKLLQ